LKTTISIPDEIFHGAERQARRTRQSRSRLYAEALSEYLDRHAPDDVTHAMNRVIECLPEPTDPFLTGAAHRVLDRTEW